MRRLIDEDKLYEDLTNNLSCIMGDGSDGEAIDTYAIIGDIIHDTFNAQPTAYDPDKVVEQLESESARWQDSGDAYNDEKEKGVAIGFRKAIEIVKGGGVDGN